MARSLLVRGTTIIAWLAGVGIFVFAALPTMPDLPRGAILTGLIAIPAVVLAYEQGRSNRNLQRSLPRGVLGIMKWGELNRDKPLTERIQRSKSDILIVAQSMISIAPYFDQLELKARDGAAVRLLVPDPLDSQLVLMIGRQHHPERTYLTELDAFFERIVIYWRRTNGAIQVRAHTKLPSVSAAMFDECEGNVVFPMYGWGVADRLALELDYNGAASDFKRNIELLWRNAEKVDSEAAFESRRTAVAKLLTHTKSL